MTFIEQDNAIVKKNMNGDIFIIPRYANPLFNNLNTESTINEFKKHFDNYQVFFVKQK